MAPQLFLNVYNRWILLQLSSRQMLHFEHKTLNSFCAYSKECACRKAASRSNALFFKSRLLLIIPLINASQICSLQLAGASSVSEVTILSEDAQRMKILVQCFVDLLPSQWKNATGEKALFVFEYVDWSSASAVLHAAQWAIMKKPLETRNLSKSQACWRQ